MLTLSIIKADTGGFVGHSAVHPELVAAADQALRQAVDGRLLVDGRVATCGDDLSLIMTHRQGVDSQLVHSFAWDTFHATTRVAQHLHLYGAGQDLLSDAFSGNLRGMGPGYAELDFEERPSEPVICFLADKTEPGAWNLPLYKIFADPFNTAGLVIDAKMHAGFVFEVYDLYEEKRIEFDCPAELHDLLMFIGAPARYVVHSVRSKTLNETAAATSTQRLSLIAGRYVGKDDPVMIVRCQSGLPAVGEVLEPFATAWTVAGCMRGSHHAPLMPVGQYDAHPSRFDGPPRVVALGLQIHDGRLVGPRDLFADPAFDAARAEATRQMDYLRRHGPFEPHRLPLDELEYTTMPTLEERLAGRWHPIEGPLVPVDVPAQAQRQATGVPATPGDPPRSDQRRVP
jgi:fructose 1,6-bisphosphate aldolase/phosphatase